MRVLYNNIANMKKAGFRQPNGTIPFEVKQSDTLVSIAAQCDISVGHLKKINRLMSENIFPGQMLYVPGPNYVPSNFIAPSSPSEKSPSDHNSSAPNLAKLELGTSPIRSVPGHTQRPSFSSTEPVMLPRALSEDEVKKIDGECDQRFVKMDAKYIEPRDEEVPGVLLVTPDAFLFDADDSHPLVCQNGREAYQLVTSIWNITLVTIYHGTTTSKFCRCPSNEVDMLIKSDANCGGENLRDSSNREKLNQLISVNNNNKEGTSVTDSSLCTELSLTDDNGKVSKVEVKDNKSIDVGDILKSQVVKESADKANYVILRVKDNVEENYNASVLGDGPAPDITAQPTCDKFTVSNDMTTISLTENKDAVTGNQNTSAMENNDNVLLHNADETRHSLEGTSSSHCNLSNTPVYSKMSKCVASTDLEAPITVFLCVKVDRSIEAMKGYYNEAPSSSDVQGPVKSEYWYIIPCDKAALLFAFFAQWVAEDGTKGFVVTGIDSTVDYKKYSTVDGEKLVCKITKDWELWSSVEYRRMKSMEEIRRLPLPELSESSSIMRTSHIAVLICHLPPIAEGSPWRLVYSTSKHGISLNTLYRKMHNVDSPVFLIIQDVNDQVFGALISCTLKMSEHFYGSGETYLFTFYPEFKKFGWTGMNSFFVKGNKDSLAIGAGKGSNGLWLDGSLYHGRTQQCQTFENELLTISQDFTIKCLETWSFI